METTIGLSNFGQKTMIADKEYSAFKTLVFDNTQIINRPAGDISINGSYLCYKDKKMYIENKKPFLKLLGANALKKISESTNDKVVDSLINAYLKSTKKNVSIYFDAKGELIKVALTEDVVSPENYFKLVEQIGNQYNLELDKMNFYQGNASVAFRGNNEIGITSKEIYQNGISLNWKGTVEFNPYLLRLVCTNGMRYRTEEESHVLNGSTTEAWDSFLKNIAESATNNFVPTGFKGKILKAMDANASLSELLNAERVLEAAIGKDAEFLLIDNSKYTFQDIKAEFYKNKLYFPSFSDDKKKNLRTPIKVLDLVNTITDIASHNYGYEIDSKNTENLRIQAGKILGREHYDNENIVPQIF